MAIVTVVAIITIIYLKTNMHLSGIKPGIKCKELIPEWLPTRRSSRLSLVSWDVSLGLGTARRIMTFLFAVEVGDLGKILATETSLTDGARRVDTGDRGRALSSLLSISTMLFPFSSPSESLYWRSCRSQIAKNMDARSIGACIKPFRRRRRSCLENTE